jgi:hypothetical protein
MKEYSRWLYIHGKWSNREYSDIKNTVMFSTFTAYGIISVSRLAFSETESGKTDHAE